MSRLITAAERTARRAQPRGLGDVIARATTALGIKPCAGCKRRQATLNRLVPFQSGQSAQPASTQNHHEPIHPRPS